MKILISGLNQANFITPLFKKIKEANPSYSFELLNIWGDNKDKNFESIFEKKHTLYENNIRSYSLISLFKSAIEIFTEKMIMRQFLIAKAANSEKSFFYFFMKGLRHSLYVRKSKLFRNCHIVNIHYCDPSFSQIVDFIPENTKLICSIWGSDLMRINGELNYFLQRKMFERADLITLQSLEMREILLAKFGRHLKPKVRLTLFGNDDAFFNTIDQVDNDEDISFFKEQLNLSHDKKLILVGHNANAFNNHLAILEQISKLKNKEKIIIILPFTYGNNNPEYAAKVESFCKEVSIKYIMLNKYLSIKELALLRVCTDIMIQMPESDAQSAAMIETLYAGNIVITGSWLPYGNLRRSNIRYYETEDFNKLPDLLDNILDDFNSFLPKVDYQKKQIREHYHIKYTIENWLNVFNELSP